MPKFRTLRTVSVLLGVLMITAAFAEATRVLAADAPARVTIIDEQGKPHELAAEDLAKLPRKTAKVPDRDKEGSTIEYAGAALSDVLAHCGVVLGKELRGPRVANYLLLEAQDGYRVVLALVEVDPATTDKIVLLADKRDGGALGEKEGPFRLVMPDEKRPVRWIRMLQRISVRSAPPAETAK